MDQRVRSEPQLQWQSVFIFLLSPSAVGKPSKQCWGKTFTTDYRKLLQGIYSMFSWCSFSKEFWNFCSLRWSQVNAGIWHDMTQPFKLTNRRSQQTTDCVFLAMPNVLGVVHLLFGRVGALSLNTLTHVTGGFNDSQVWYGHVERFVFRTKNRWS